MTPSSRRYRGVGSRGFTLVELLIVVSMIGILSALALVGYRKYLNSAQASEAKGVIQMIRGGQETYKAEMLTYLNVSQSITAWYPQGGQPTDARWAWVNETHADWKNWRQLNVQPDGPVRFGYACIAGVGGTPPTFPAPFVNSPTPAALTDGTPWFEVMATIKRDGTGQVQTFASASMTGEIFESEH